MSSRVQLGIIAVVLGLFLSFGGAAIYASYERRSAAAGENAAYFLMALEENIRQNQLQTVITEAPSGQMPRTSLQEQPFLGILEAEEAGIRLPVLDNWSYDRLELGACRWSGSLEDGTLILLGHNYEGHLADLDQLEPGDPICFTDVNGHTTTFLVDHTEVIAPHETDALSQPDCPLTIFTCTPGGQNRYVVWCK